MKKIITSVRAAELADTAIRLSELFKKTSSVQTNAFLTKIFTEVEQQAMMLTTSVRKDLAVSKLEEADKARSYSVRVLDKLLKGYETIPVENLKIHAQKLIEIFKKYGVKITRENYTAETTFIASMLEDFSAENVKESVEALSGVKEALSDIKEKQHQFIMFRDTYDNDLALQKKKLSATDLKKPLLELINQKIVPYLVAMEIAEPELYGEFIAKASQVVNSTNEAVKARGKR